jgi:fatty-acyl-CoA synthase
MGMTMNGLSYDSYPLTASGKVQKFVLCERAIKALGLEEVANVRTA